MDTSIIYRLGLRFNLDRPKFWVWRGDRVPKKRERMFNVLILSTDYKLLLKDKTLRS